MIKNTLYFPDLDVLHHLRTAAERANGEFLGVQLKLLPDQQDQLWCINPLTGHKFSVGFDFTWFDPAALEQDIKAAIAEDRATKRQRTVSVPVRVLKQLAEKLLKLSQEIEALYEEKR